MMLSMILVAIGANLPGPGGRSPQQTCNWAADRLAKQPGLQLVSRSHWYATAPVPASDQPDYVNGVVSLSGELSPEAVLAALQRIEHDAGRVRGAANAARTLDLDLLAADDRVIDTDTLTLPHPRLDIRAFVLVPMNDVAPDWTHPRLGRTTASLLAALPDRASVTKLTGNRP